MLLRVKWRDWGLRALYPAWCGLTSHVLLPRLVDTCSAPVLSQSLLLQLLLSLCHIAGTPWGLCRPAGTVVCACGPGFVLSFCGWQPFCWCCSSLLGLGEWLYLGERCKLGEWRCSGGWVVQDGGVSVSEEQWRGGGCRMGRHGAPGSKALCCTALGSGGACGPSECTGMQLWWYN